MLTSKHLKNIEGIVQKIVQENLKEAFHDFYENIFEPFASRTEEKFLENNKQHKEIINEIKAIRSDGDEMKEFIKDHEKRITSLESSALIKY